MTLIRLICIAALFPFILAINSPDSPAFREIKDPAKRRKAFVEFIGPRVRQVNEQIMKDRERLITLFEQFEAEKTLKASDESWLKELASTHNVSFDPANKKSYEELLVRVDIVPVSLALAQAANESGWGTSKFAVRGNNFFGHFCKKKGCGMVPGPKGKENASEAKKFPSAFESVKAYVYNLNSHKAYEKLRRDRAQLRKEEKKLDGSVLADGLVKYSTRGKAYVRDIKKMVNSGLLKDYAVS